jgi:hypothetical protein
MIFPNAALAAIDLCHAQSERPNDIAPQHARIVSFDPDAITQAPILSRGENLEGSLPVKKESRSPLDARSDLVPRLFIRAPTAHDRNIGGVRPEGLGRIRVAIAELLRRGPHVMDCLLEVLLCVHWMPLL